LLLSWLFNPQLTQCFVLKGGLIDSLTCIVLSSSRQPWTGCLCDYGCQLDNHVPRTNHYPLWLYLSGLTCLSDSTRSAVLYCTSRSIDPSGSNFQGPRGFTQNQPFLSTSL